MGYPGYIELLVLLAICFFVVWRALARSPVLVLRRFELRSHPQKTETPLVEIVGRNPGIIAFMLTVMGLNDQTTFSINTFEVEY